MKEIAKQNQPSTISKWQLPPENPNKWQKKSEPLWLLKLLLDKSAKEANIKYQKNLLEIAANTQLPRSTWSENLPPEPPTLKVIAEQHKQPPTNKPIDKSKYQKELRDILKAEQQKLQKEIKNIHNLQESVTLMADILESPSFQQTNWNNLYQQLGNKMGLFLQKENIHQRDSLSIKNNLISNLNPGSFKTLQKQATSPKFLKEVTRLKSKL